MTNARARIAARYTLLSELGRGGMGAVYLAQDSVLQREVALKQLNVAALEERQRRHIEMLFEREYYTLVKLKHPRIIEVYDYGRDAAGPYYTMELLPGLDLLQRAPLPYRELCAHLCDVASSLALIHAHRLVHRDVSPRNIRFAASGRCKLIDFGALTPFGVCREIIGTPVCIAPETVRAMPLDQRTDLYALGVVAYLGLTGRAPYPARELSDLNALWTTPPVPPSHYADVPAALDALILSLLKPDPTERPASAAVVIDQLAAIAQLELEEHTRAAESYLSSGAFVGRDSELEWLGHRVERLQKGRGTELLVEGSAGIGKTRLLHEVLLRAQLRGVVVIKADAQASSEAFGMVGALANDLLTVCFERAYALAQPHASVLAQLSPDIRHKLGEPQLAAAAADPGEHRARLQAALYEWFLALARAQPLVVGVDNLQAADDSSAAFLAALGQEARELPLLIVATQRTGVPVTAPEPVQVLRQRAGRLKLAGLDAPACLALVISLFGDVANTGRLAQLLYDRSAGNPQRCMELARLLVKNQSVKYGAGAWVLPMEVAEQELPQTDEALTLARLGGMSQRARACLDALAVQTRPVTLETYRKLVDVASDADFHAALDELTAEQLLLADAGNYRFAQDSVRQIVLGQLDEGTRRTYYRRAAETLLQHPGQDKSARLVAGWHLVHAGEVERGVEILAAEGRAYVAGQVGAESGKQALGALQAAIEIYQQQGRSEYMLGCVLFPMQCLAYYEDWRLVLKHCEHAIALGLRITGLGLARRLRPYIGKKLALLFGLGVAWVKFARERRRGLDYGLLEALSLFCGMIPASTGVVATGVDIQRNRRIQALLEPLTYFPEHELPRLIYDCMQSFVMINSYDSRIVPLLASMQLRFQQPKIKAQLGEGNWKAISGLVPLQSGLMAAFQFGDAALQNARELDELGIRVWSMAADNIRLLYHAIRGESEPVQHYAARIDRFAVQGSTTWQAEMYIPLFTINAYILWGDTIAVRRAWEQFSRWSKEVPSLQIYADAAHAAYLLLRGDLALALEEYARLVPRYRLREQANWQSIRNAYAQALNAAGQHAQAKAVVLEAMSAMDEHDKAWAAFYLEAQRQLALAEAGLGHEQQAVTQLDALIAEHGHHNNGLLIGLLNQARASIAIRMTDRTAFDRHFAAMKERFFELKNPALSAQCERLLNAAVRAGLSPSIAASAWPDLDDTSAKAQMLTAITDLQDAEDPNRVALELLMRTSKARAGYLYLVQANEVRLALASVPHEPPDGLESQLKQHIERARSEARERILETQQRGRKPEASDSEQVNAVDNDSALDEQDTVFVRSVPAPLQNASGHQLIVLNASGSEYPVVGGIILELDPEHGFALYPEFLEAVANVLALRNAANSVAA